MGPKKRNKTGRKFLERGGRWLGLCEGLGVGEHGK